MSAYVGVLIGTSITFAATAFGAAIVFLLKKVNETFNRICLGLASGIMVAASIWSLILPSLELAEQNGTPKFVPAVVGIAAGTLFLYLLNRYITAKENKKGATCENSRRNKLLLFSITLHNIPEGMAVGLTFAMAFAVNSTVSYVGAMAFAIGIAIQNIPEGAAISMPLMQNGMSRKKSFLLGASSGIVEPIAGIITVLAVGSISVILPYFLAFAAGAMLYVVVSELIPSSVKPGSVSGVMSFMAGFLIMMFLDIFLG